MLSREVSTLECVHHPYILRLFEVVETLGRVHLVTEWVRGGELYHRITHGGPLPELQAAQLYRQLLLAVKHMHNLGFVHRDIKAENVLLVTEDRIKLADFGFSTQLINGPWQHLDTFCGSPPYAAPELFSDDHYIGGPVDVWALGVLLYFMVVGNMPFRAPTVPALRSAVLKGDYTLPPQLTLPCNRVIQRILVHTPSRRPSIDQLLESQWLTSPSLLKELHDYQLALHAPRISRRKSIWFPARDRNLAKNKNNQNGQPRQYVPHICSTKRGGSVLAENFLHPIEQFRTHNPSDIPAANPKRSLFSATLKKKIGPIEMVDATTTSDNNSSAGTNHTKKSSAFALNKKFLKNRSIDSKSIEFLKDTTPPSKEGTPISKTVPPPNNVFSLKSKFEDADFQDEQKGFVMLPTNGTAQDMDDIEREARRILEALGISSTMLSDALSSGPRSDIIGAYRIIVHRLQKQAMLVKQAESIVIEEPAKPKNTRKVCVIL